MLVNNGDQTGKMVFGYTGNVGYTPCIYMDCGFYEGTIKEYNTRAVKEIEIFEGLRWNDEAIQAIKTVANKETYGLRWGGGKSELKNITDEEIAQLRKANSIALKKAEEEKEAERVEYAKYIIEKAEKQSKIPTFKEAREMEKRWNDTYNEGGEGYVPHIIDIDEYNRALAVIG